MFCMSCIQSLLSLWIIYQITVFYYFTWRCSMAKQEAICDTVNQNSDRSGHFFPTQTRPPVQTDGCILLHYTTPLLPPESPLTLYTIFGQYFVSPSMLWRLSSDRIQYWRPTVTDVYLCWQFQSKCLTTNCQIWYPKPSCLLFSAI